MRIIEIKTQMEFETALKAGDIADLVAGSFSLITKGNESPHMIVRAGVSLHVEARESSQPHVGARESSQPHVVAWASSQPHVEANGYVQLSIYGKVIAKCTAKVSILIDGIGSKVSGGKKTIITPITTVREWCDRYAVTIKKGIAILYKSVDDDYSTNNARAKNIFYKPGNKPSAPDWDGGKEECGGGLHFCPSPIHAELFNKGKHFMACPIKISDIVIHKNAKYPTKVKAPGVCADIYEVDRMGIKI